MSGSSTDARNRFDSAYYKNVLRRNGVEEMARPTITKENILCYFEQFRKLNTNKIEHRRRLIDSFVNAIFLYDDKMVITFNYREQTKTITFADLEKSGIGSDISAVAAPKKRLVNQAAFLLFCKH